jgi:drug/metabolite transporter (DMT)-like permease
MLWLAYLIGLIVLVVIVLRIDDGLKIPPLKKCLTLTGASLMNLGGIAAILGYVFFKERRGKVQVSGVVLVLVGAFVLHLKT